MASDLLAQIAREKAELEAAPKVTPGPNVLRCHFCGRVTPTLTFVETVHGFDRMKGECCAKR